MRGGGELVSVTIEPTAEYAAHTGLRSKPFDIAFVTYAGPWAEARAQWPAEVSLDAEDGDVRVRRLHTRCMVGERDR